MKKLFLKKNIKGFIIIEILIAFSILLINITSIMLIINSQQIISSDIEINSQALYKIDSLLEQVKAEARFDFNLLKSKTEEMDGIYKKNLSVEQIDIYTKKIIAKINWVTQNFYKQEIEITSLLTNPSIIDGGDTCSFILSNPENWKSPQHYSFTSKDLLTSPTFGFAISDIDVFNKKLYITSNQTPNSTAHNFFIFSLPTNINQKPTLIGSLDNNANSKTGLNAVWVNKDYAYVANAYTGSSANCQVNNNCAQFQVIDITEPTNPSIIPSANLKLPTITSSGKLSYGTSIYYSNGYVYLGLSKAMSGPEFNIIDVGGGGPPASPNNPIWKSGYIIGNGINSIYVKNNRAYIASPNSKNLIILDVSDPNNPSLSQIGSYTPENLPEVNGVGSNHGKDIYVIGHDAYLGRTYGPKEFYILDTNDINDITIKGSALDIGLGNKMSINKLFIRDYLAFFITPDQFQIWNISDPNNIKPWTVDSNPSSFISMSTFGGNGITADCENDYLYIGIKNTEEYNDLLTIITSEL
jgi:hypothetical protein